MADIPTGGTRNIKSMWEKGNISSSSESPTPTVKVRKRQRDRGQIYRHKTEHLEHLFSQDVAGIKGGVAGRVNSWMAKPAEVEKTPEPAPAPAPEPAPAPAKAVIIPLLHHSQNTSDTILT